MDEITKEFLVESYENLDRLDQDLLTLEKDPHSKETIASALLATGDAVRFMLAQIETAGQTGDKEHSELIELPTRLNSGGTATASVEAKVPLPISGAVTPLVAPEATAPVSAVAPAIAAAQGAPAIVPLSPAASGGRARCDLPLDLRGERGGQADRGPSRPLETPDRGTARGRGAPQPHAHDSRPLLFERNHALRESQLPV